MKKLIAGIIILNTLVMCQKSEVKQWQDHIKSADSLIGQVQDHIKTIDSVSVNFDSVSIPHIIKEKEKLEKVFKDSKESMDSLSSNINEFKKTVESKEIQKKIDSVSSKIKSLDDLRKLKEQVKVVYKDRPQQQQQLQQQQQQPRLDALTKTASLEVNVDNLTEAHQQLKLDLSKFDGQILTENIVSNNELQTMYVTAKVPLSKFDYFVDSISNNLGSIKSKNIEVKGQDYSDNQMCTVQLTLVENQNLLSENKDKPENQSFSQKAGDAVGSGGKVLGDIVLFLLPFWPLFLIVGVGIFLYRRKFKKDKTDSNNPQYNPNEKSEE